MKTKAGLSLKRHRLFRTVTLVVSSLAGVLILFGGNVWYQEWHRGMEADRLFKTLSLQNDDESQFYIYVAGGSTAAGTPFHLEPSSPNPFGQLVAYRFGNRLRGRPIRVISLAIGGIHISDVFEILQKLLKSKHPPGHALLLLYSGHNEFNLLEVS